MEFWLETFDGNFEMITRAATLHFKDSITRSRTRLLLPLKVYLVIDGCEALE